MDLKLAETLAKKTMKKYLSDDWTFQFSRAKNTLGSCASSKKLIKLSAPVTQVNNEDRILNTLLHEIAHALVGTKHGHDFIWQNKCLEIGGDGKRLATLSKDQTPTPKYSLVCPVCGPVSSRERKPVKRIACKHCCDTHNNGKFSERFMFEIVQNY